MASLCRERVIHEKIWWKSILGGRNSMVQKPGVRTSLESSWNVRKSKWVELSKWGGIYTWKGFRKLNVQERTCLHYKESDSCSMKGLGCLQGHQMGDFHSTQTLSLNGTTFPIFSIFPTIQLGHQPGPGILLWTPSPSWVGCPSLCSHSSLHLSHVLVIENFRFNLYLPPSSISFSRAGNVSYLSLHFPSHSSGSCTQ